MSVFSKLAFWKKRDELSELGLGTPSGFGKETGFDNLGLPKEDYGFSKDFGQDAAAFQPSFGQQQRPFQAQQPSYPQQQQMFTVDKDMEIISSKLDALRASLESLNQRLANIERIARGEEEERHTRSRW